MRQTAEVTPAVSCCTDGATQKCTGGTQGSSQGRSALCMMCRAICPCAVCSRQAKMPEADTVQGGVPGVGSATASTEHCFAADSLFLAALAAGLIDPCTHKSLWVQQGGTGITPAERRGYWALVNSPGCSAGGKSILQKLKARAQGDVGM